MDLTIYKLFSKTRQENIAKKKERFTSVNRSLVGQILVLT